MTLTRRALLGGLLATPIAAYGGAYVWRRRFLNHARPVVAVDAAVPSRDGAGVVLKKALGGRVRPYLDPFLMLDEFGSDDVSDWIAGFPKHPHRGFETVTIMLAGEVEHKDSVGNAGVLGPGSLQWMTAARGIVHSEMPKADPGVLRGFQLWVNLPSHLKMTPPRYQDRAPGEIPTVLLGETEARLLAGRVGKTEGSAHGIATAPTLLEGRSEIGRPLYHELPEHQSAFVYVADGHLRIGPEETPVPAGHLAVLGRGRGVVLEGEGRFLLAAGDPLNEPVARRGPFVMNTDAEIEQAWADYRSGRLVDPA